MILAFLNLTLLAFAEETPRWWDYPGFELWKFINLAIFVALLVFIFKKWNLREAFRTRRVVSAQTVNHPVRRIRSGGRGSAGGGVASQRCAVRQSARIGGAAPTHR